MSESACQRCGRSNPIWAAPSPLWNYVMREGHVRGGEEQWSVVCPSCFAELAEEAGVGPGYEPIDGRTIIWRLVAAPGWVSVPLQTAAADGSVWNPDEFMWVRP